MLVIGILLELGNAAYSWHNGLLARGHDPWRGSTLEWYALSPPPPHNFDAVPDVRSAEPLHDIRESIAVRERTFVAPAGVERLAASEPTPEPGPAAQEPEAAAPEASPSATAVAEPERGTEPPEESPGDSDDGDSAPVA